MFELNTGLSDYFNQCYVITLPKRKEYIKNTFNQMNIIYTPFNAILGKDLNKNKLISDGILKNSYLNENIIACSLSHLEVIRKFYNSSFNDYDTCIIFEDDIVLNKNHLKQMIKIMNNIPKDWDLINLGRCWDTCTKDIQINNYIVKSTDPLCTQSYGITRKCAKIIIDNFYPIRVPVDTFYVQLQTDNKIKIYSSIDRVYEQIKSNGINNSTLGNYDSANQCKEYIDYKYIKYIQILYKNNIFIIILFLILIVLYLRLVPIYHKLKT